MERIQRALEKAKQQRQAITDEKNVIGLDPSKDKDPQPLDSNNVVHNYLHSHVNPNTVNIDRETLQAHRIVTGLKDDPRVDIFKILRSKILLRMRENQWNVLAITSPTEGNGKSLMAVNLALSIAMEANHSVLLVDLDLRRPSVHRYFGLKMTKGIIDYLNDEAPLSELFLYPNIRSLVILPAGESIRHSSELLSSQKMNELADELKNRYPDRIVIIDLPPLLTTDDAIVFLPKVDACLMVVAEGENTAEQVLESIKLIDEKKYLGSVLNKSSDSGLFSYD